MNEHNDLEAAGLAGYALLPGLLSNLVDLKVLSAEDRSEIVNAGVTYLNGLFAGLGPSRAFLAIAAAHRLQNLR